MKKYDKEKMAKSLDLISSGTPIRKIAKLLKVNPRTIFYWRTRSAAGDADLILSWGEFGEAQYEAHYRSAFAMSIAHAESEIASIVNRGYWEEDIFFQGQECFKLDPLKVGLTDEECMEQFGNKDRYLREVDGAAIPLRARRKPSDAMAKLMLGSHMKGVYGDHTSVDVRVTGGLKILPRKGDSASAKVIEHKPAEGFSVDQKQDGEEARPQIALGRPAKDTAELDKWAAEGDLDPHPVNFELLGGETKTVNPVDMTANQTAPTSPAQGAAPVKNQKLEILDTDSDMVREMKTKFNQKLDDIASGKVTQPQITPKFSAGTSNDPPETTGGQPVDGKPVLAEPRAAPVGVNASNYKEHPRYIEALQKRANGLHEDAIDKQLLDNGNWHVLKPYQAELDHVGRGRPRAGGQLAQEPVHPWGVARRSV